MSYQAVTAVLNRAVAAGADWQVLVCMAEDSRDSRTCRTGPARIAARANMHERSAKRCVRSLVESGHLVLLEKGGGRDRPSVYGFAFLDWPVKEGVRTRHEDPPPPAETVSSGAINSDRVSLNSPAENSVRGSETVSSGPETVSSGAVNSDRVSPKPVGTSIEPVRRALRARAREVDPPELALVADDGETIPDLADVIVGDWNRTCEVIASEHLGKPTPTPVTKITPARRERIAALLPVIGGQPEWRDAFNRLRRDPWWRGSERRVKPLTFDELTTARNGRDAPIIEISELDNAPRDAIDAAVANGHFSQREAAFQRELARLDGDEPARRGELETVDECGF